MKINIYRKARNGKAKMIETIETDGTFAGAVEACDQYRATIGKTTDKVYWIWSDSAWIPGK